MPEERGQGREVEAARPRRARRRQARPRRAGVALERRRRLAPAAAGSARQDAGAGVRGEGVEALDERERRRVARRRRQRRRRAGGRRRAAPSADGSTFSSLRPWRRPSTNAAPVAASTPSAPSRLRRVAPRQPPRASASLAASVRPPREEAPHQRKVERQMQRHEQHRAVAEQVVPVEHRQLLVGDPEDAETRRRRHVGEQEHARADVDRGARRRAAAQELQREHGRREQQRQRDPENLRHRRDLEVRSSLADAPRAARGHLPPGRGRTAPSTVGSHRLPEPA